MIKPGAISFPFLLIPAHPNLQSVMKGRRTTTRSRSRRRRGRKKEKGKKEKIRVIELERQELSSCFCYCCCSCCALLPLFRISYFSINSLAFEARASHCQSATLILHKSTFHFSPPLSCQRYILRSLPKFPSTTTRATMSLLLL